MSHFVQLIGGYTAPRSLTKVSDVTKKISTPTAVQRSSVGSDSPADVSDLADTASVASIPPLVQDLHRGGAHHATARYDRRTSLEMPAGVTSASSINLNFERTQVKSHGSMRGSTVSSRTAGSRGASRRKH